MCVLGTFHISSDGTPGFGHWAPLDGIFDVPPSDGAILRARGSCTAICCLHGEDVRSGTSVPYIPEPISLFHLLFLFLVLSWSLGPYTLYTLFSAHLYEWLVTARRLSENGGKLHRKEAPG